MALWRIKPGNNNKQNNATNRQLEKFIWIPYCINNLVSFPFCCLFLVHIICLPFFAICLICHVLRETLSLKQVDLWPFSRDLLARAMQVAFICVCGLYLLCQDFMLMLFLDFVAKDRRPIGNRFLNSKKWIGNLIFFHFTTIWIECVFTLWWNVNDEKHQRKKKKYFRDYLFIARKKMPILYSIAWVYFSISISTKIPL